MQIAQAQADLRRAYTDGGPGVVVSGLVWIAASIITSGSGVEAGFTVLFLGGMLIFPLALLVNRVFLRRAKESGENPYGMLVLEGTIAMIAMLFAAWLFLPYNSDMVFPLSAIAVGTHYFAFKTAYGMKVFWLLGAVMTLLGFAAIYQFLPLPGGLVLVVGIVEVIFGIGISARALGRPA